LPSLKRDYKHIFESDYGLTPPEPKDSDDYLDNTFVIQAKYPVLRLTAAEFGPWFLFVGFALQFYAVLINP